jgi:hypothetical protein
MNRKNEQTLTAIEFEKNMLQQEVDRLEEKLPALGEYEYHSAKIKLRQYRQRIAKLEKLRRRITKT